MIQNFIRCVLTPLRRKGGADFKYFLHTYTGAGATERIGLLHEFFPFCIMTLTDKDIASGMTMTDFSLRRVGRMWRSVGLSFDLIVCVRLDLLFSRPLTDRDVERVLEGTDHLFTTCYPSVPLRQCFVAGNKEIMASYTANRHDPWHTNTTTETLSVVYVRIGPDGVVRPGDRGVCPYLSDLIASSPTTIRLTKARK